MKTRTTWIALLGLMLLPVAAHAQEQGQVGLSMGFPTSVGVIWYFAG